MPTWSRPTPSTSAAPRPSAKPPASRSKALLLIWPIGPIGPRKTATHCSASSPAIPERRKVRANLRTKIPPMLPKLNRKRALFVLIKIDEILAWERRSEAERDTRFVELGRYLCEVRAGQYWRLEKLKSFDEFLTRRFPESRRKAYYLMSIHGFMSTCHRR